MPQVSEQIIRVCSEQPNINAVMLDKIKHRVCAAEQGPLPATDELREAYGRLVANQSISAHPVLDALLKRRGVRTASGVCIITVLTKPYPCPGQCVYCPTEVRMPKSYLASEPAAQRALRLDFDPYVQVYQRLAALHANGHATDKIELIVKGGTWNAYPWTYQLWFIRRCYDGCNDFFIRNMVREAEPQPIKTHEKLNEFIRDEEKKILTAQMINETAHSRMIGMTLETRPDWVRPHIIHQMRLLGCTRIELGLQHTDDEIMRLTKRGHTLAHTCEAMRLLRLAGFKVDVHTMPQLPGATPAHDRAMYEQIFSDPRLRPDMIKIYPCVVTQNAEIAAWHADGRYVPYPTEDLIELLVGVKSELIPRWCRISRLIRDIPGNEIIAGNRVTNLREVIQKNLRARGLRCVCLRCREISHAGTYADPVRADLSVAESFEESYRASHGTEYFLSIEDPTRALLYAFCRLYIPDAPVAGDEARAKLHTLLPETINTAFLRELHTYGHLVPIAGDAKDAQQHRGLGKKLMARAEEIARASGLPHLAVISGVGVRGYYVKIGFHLQGTYMVKSLRACLR